MENLAPNITRQRLLVEGFFKSGVDKQFVEEYLYGVAAHLDLRTYGEPTIHSPEGMGSGENQGFDAFIPLIDSGISLYVWTEEKFMSVIFYTCKEFSSQDAIGYTKEFFAIEGDVATHSF